MDKDSELWQKIATELAIALLLELKKEVVPGREGWGEAARAIAGRDTRRRIVADLSLAAVEVVERVAEEEGAREESLYRQRREGKCEAGYPKCPLHAKARSSKGMTWCPEVGCNWTAEGWGPDCPHIAMAEVSDATATLKVCSLHLMAIRHSPIPDVRVRLLGRSGNEGRSS